VATARDAAPERTQYWVVPVVRGLLALVPAAVITFSPNHSPELGLLVFGSWAIVSGLVLNFITEPASAGWLRCARRSPTIRMPSGMAVMLSATVLPTYSGLRTAIS